MASDPIRDAMITWRCEACGALHVQDTEPLCCHCGHDWNPLTAPREEVDAYARQLGVDPDDVRAEGASLAVRVLERKARRGS